MAASAHNPNGSNLGETGGWFRRGLKRIAVARELQARRIVADTFRNFDDATLASYGLDRKTLNEDLGARHLW